MEHQAQRPIRRCRYDPDSFRIIADDGYVVADLLAGVPPLTPETQFIHADGRLLAAAPRLVAALDALLRRYESSCPTQYATDDAAREAADAIRSAFGA